MNDRDRSNLQFIMSLDEKAYDEWTASLSEDDVDYALELLKAARTEVMMQAASFVDEVEDCTEANTLLSKFTMKVDMTPFTEFVLQHCTLIGEWTIRDQIQFTTMFSKKDLENLGDVIYFVVYKGMVIKVGLTVNMYARQKSYENNQNCKTTQRVLREAKLYNIPNAQIYVRQIPRVNSSIKSFFSGLTYNEGISQLKKCENIYIYEAEKAGETLVFNKQKISK